MSDDGNLITETSVKTSQNYPRWVGVVMGFLIPGSAHFLSGRKLLGLGWFFGFYALLVGMVAAAGAPGQFWGILAWSLAVALVLYLPCLLITSYRPVHRLGCFGWILFVVLLFVGPEFVAYPAATIFKEYVTEAFVVTGSAMSPTLLGTSDSRPSTEWSDYIAANKWIYRVSEPQRGDLVIFRHRAGSPEPNDSSSTILLMRIVGLPGETIDIEPPNVLIDGKPLTKPRIFKKISSKRDGYSGYFRLENLMQKGIPLPIMLGPDEYFLLGDHSPGSYDSRFWGPVSRQDIIGKAIRIYFPFSRIRELE